MYRGKDIYLRPIITEDVDLIYAWENNPSNWKVSSITQPYTREQIEQFVNLNQDIFTYEQLRLIICKIDTNEVIGNIDLFEFEPLHKRVGVGILIDEQYRNQKFGYKSIQLVESYCKEILGVKTMFCNILKDNLESIKLFRKCKFEFICTKPNWHFYNDNWFDENFYIKKI